MIRHLIWLQLVSAKNRFLRWLARLRQPRYVVASLVAVVYLGVLAFRSGPQAFRVGGDPVDLGANALEGLLALIFFFVLLVPWALPSSTRGLEFTEAEVHFLFTAPLARSHLVIYRLVKVQRGLLLTTVITAFIFARQANPLGIWLVLNALTVYFMTVAFARARLAQAGVGWQIRLALVVAAAVGFAALAAHGVRRLVAPALQAAGDRHDAQQIAGALLSLFDWGPMEVILFLPSIFAAPLYSSSAAGFAVAAAGIVGVTALSLFLMIRLDVSFEEASVALASKKAKERERREGKRASDLAVTFRRMPVPFVLGRKGPPELAVVWKNLIAGGRVYAGSILVIVLSVFLLVAGVAMSGRGEQLLRVTGLLTLFAAGSLFFIGPLIFRNDLRADIDRIDLLRTWPIEGWRMVMAQVAGPTAVTLSVQALLVIVAAVQLLAVIPARLENVFYAAIAFPLLAVPLVAVQVIIQNAIVILLPGWHTPLESRGLAAGGQRLIVMLAQLLALAIALVPGALFFALAMFFGVKLGIGGPRFLLLAAVPVSTLLLLECWAALRFLGEQYERIDVATELNGG